MFRLLCAFALLSVCQAIFPLHHHHHIPTAVSHQHIEKHDGPHHPIAIHHPVPFHHHIPLEHHHVPIHHVPHVPHVPIHHDHYAFPEYNFAYSVHDHHTGDVKSQHEFRHGDVVQGGYELIEPDGRTRKVEYKADDHTGRNYSYRTINALETVHQYFEYAAVVDQAIFDKIYELEKNIQNTKTETHTKLTDFLKCK